MVNETLEPTADASAPVLLRLDFGCGGNKKKDEDGTYWYGVDCIPFEGEGGPDMVMDVCKPIYGFETVGRHCDTDHQEFVVIGYEPWPWPDNSVSEAHAAHFLEHLDQNQRVHFFNELYRVLIPGGKAQIITPYWASTRAFGDPTHKWPALSEMAYFYLNAKWRNGDPDKGLGANAPHTDIAHNPLGFSCDFEFAIGYAVNEELNLKPDDVKAFNIANYINGAADMWSNLSSNKPALPASEE